MDISVRRKGTGLFNFFKSRSKYQNMPADGDVIKITWLRPARNAPMEINAYIGMQGTVSESDPIDGSFVLNCATCILIHTEGPFNYIKLNS